MRLEVSGVTETAAVKCGTVCVWCDLWCVWCMCGVCMACVCLCL